ncbi:ferritin-like fold-containing protein [Puerhibacterium puerhi]|uniref:ferritin-like fold-containing protein n=1 Tax=Puerhibacterium puerhi TaxID=2692623 RepID=UPI00135B42E6|nr:ferritin-like fold-containing protein [Puerhibacterium puerhi]
MSEQRSSTGPTTAGAHDGALAELVGLAGYVELRTFGLLAAHAVGAPDLAGAQQLARVAGRVLRRQEELLAVGTAQGADELSLMEPFRHVLDPFDERTPASSWWEGLLKGVVGHGVAGDLCRLLARGLPAQDAAAVGAAIGVTDAEREHDDAATVLVRSAAQADAVLASRLALWGRRVVGESLTLAQTLLAQRPALAGLAREAARRFHQPGEAGVDVTAWVLSELTAEHTRRMDRMGLAA